MVVTFVVVVVVIRMVVVGLFVADFVAEFTGAFDDVAQLGAGGIELDFHGLGSVADRHVSDAGEFFHGRLDVRDVGALRHVGDGEQAVIVAFEDISTGFFA